MVNKSASEIFSVAKILHSELRADDPRLSNSVKISHREGTELFIRNAFALKLDGWFMVFSEHHGHFVYCSDEVKVSMYSLIEIEEYICL